MLQQMLQVERNYMVRTQQRNGAAQQHHSSLQHAAQGATPKGVVPVDAASDAASAPAATHAA
jgi:hypothetical protein